MQGVYIGEHQLLLIQFLLECTKGVGAVSSTSAFLHLYLFMIMYTPIPTLYNVYNMLA